MSRVREILQLFWRWRDRTCYGIFTWQLRSAGPTPQIASMLLILPHTSLLEPQVKQPRYFVMTTLRPRQIP